MSSSDEKASIRTSTIRNLKDEIEAKDVEENDIFSFAAKVLDKDLLEELILKKYAWEDFRHKFGYEGMPYEATREFKEIVRKENTANVGEAISKEKWAMLKFLVADAEQPRTRDLNLVKWLINDINRNRDDPYLQYLAGNMGNGKSDFALLIAEIWQDITGGAIVTNIESCKRGIFVANQEELEEWLDKNPSRKYIFVFDEASDTADGRGDTTAVTQQLSPFIKYIRKNDGNMIIIGHTGKDVHKEVRKLCEFIHKSSKKVASFFDGVDEDGDGKGHRKTIRGIPPTSIDYDTNESSDWAWKDDIQNRCFGANSEGDRCGTTFDTNNDRLFCARHQDQGEPHASVPDERLVGTRFEDLIEDSEEEDEDGLEAEDDHEGSNEPPALPAANIDSEDPDRDDDEEEDEDVDDEEDNETDEENVEGDEDSEKVDERQRNEEEGNTTSEERNQSKEQEADSKDSVENELDQVPQKYFELVEDRTGGAYTEDTISSLSQMEQLLNNTQWKRLQSQLDEN